VLRLSRSIWHGLFIIATIASAAVLVLNTTIRSDVSEGDGVDLCKCRPGESTQANKSALPDYPPARVHRLLGGRVESISFNARSTPLCQKSGLTPFFSPQSLFQAYAKDRQDLLGGIGLHQIGTDAAIIEEFRNRSQRAEMRLKLVFWQAEKENELDRLVIQPTKKA